MSFAGPVPAFTYAPTSRSVPPRPYVGKISTWNSSAVRFADSPAGRPSGASWPTPIANVSQSDSAPPTHSAPPYAAFGPVIVYALW